MTGVSSVSAIVPTRDDTAHLSQAIESVLNQTVSDVAVEVVIVDSSAGDAVEAIADGYDDDVRYDWVEPTGVAAARNHGIDLATGVVIGFCDADDYWHAEKLEHQLPRFDKGCDVVYSDEYVVDDGSEHVIPSVEIDHPTRHHIKYFRAGGGVGSRSVLVRRECLDHHRFDERFIVREDPHLWTRLFAEFTPCRVGEPLSYKRRRSGSLTSDRTLGFRMEMLEIEDLAESYPELAEVRDEREAMAKLHYAKTLLTDEDRPVEARRVLVDLLRGGLYHPRLAVLLFVSMLPALNKRTLRAFQRVKWTMRSWRLRLD